MNVLIKKIKEFVDNCSIKKSIGKDFQYFLDEVTFINWFRVKIFGSVAVFLFIALVFVDIVNLNHENWDVSIGYSILFFSHISISLFLSVTIGFIWFKKIQTIKQISRYHNKLLIIILFFCMGNIVAIATGDVLINGTVAAYIGAIFFVAAMYIMTNVLCFMLFGLNFFFMFYMLSWVEKTNGMDLTIQNINILTFTVFAILLSRMIYYTHGRDYKNRSIIKSQKKELEKSEEKFRTAFTTSPNVITLTSVENGTYVDINNTFTKLLGYSPEDIIGKSAVELNIWHDPKDREYLVTGLKNSGVVDNLEAKFIGKDGQTITGLMSARILDVENANYLLAVTQDITGLKKAEKAMRLMKYGVDRASDCIFWMNSNARFIYVNNSACDLLGYTHEELLSMNLKQVDPKVSLNAWQDRLSELKDIKSSRFESQHLAKDGKLIPVEVTSSYMVFEGEEGIFSFARDISERKQAEKDKARTQKIISEQKKLALVGQIAGKMAHDFNNVLAVIMGNAQLALINSKEAATIKALELIFNQTVRGKNLTKNLVAFAKDQEPKQEFFRLNEKIDLVLNLLKKDLQEIELISENISGTPELLADSGMIEHALVNLLQNSIHATSMIEKPRIIIRTFHKDKDIYIEIEDNGCGIPEEALGRIYEPAFTMKGSNDTTNSYKPDIKGTGYGMANVKKYIEQHKGTIVIDSKVGKGTKITISLPVITKELTEKEIIEIKKETFCFEKYILLVEDELAISDVQYKILTHEPCNHKVDIAATGQMAVDLFDRNKYDFVSLDYILPGELDGMDVYNHIRRKNNTIPILFVSGNLDFLESIKDLKHKDPCVEHVSKPCQNKDYVRAINDLLGEI